MMMFHQMESVHQLSLQEKQPKVTAYAVKDNALENFELEIKPLTDDERQIILDGCLINYYKNH